MKYLCALGTTFEMIMKQFSSTILENNQIHMLAGLLVLYAEEITLFLKQDNDSYCCWF